MLETVRDWPFWLELLSLLLAPHIIITGAVLLVLFRFRRGFKEVAIAFLNIFSDGKKGMKLKFGSDLFSLETVEREADPTILPKTGVGQIENAGSAANTSISSTSTVNETDATWMPSQRVAELMQIDQHPLLLSEVEKDIAKILVDAGLESTSDTARVLIRNLAGTSIDRAFEKDYSLVRGSEIQLLEKMNAFVPNSMPVPVVDKHIEETRSKFPNFYTKPLSANEYLAWLLSATLVIRTDSGFGITVRGAAFLRWLIVNNKTLEKGL